MQTLIGRVNGRRFVVQSDRSTPGMWASGTDEFGLAGYGPLGEALAAAVADARHEAECDKGCGSQPILDEGSSRGFVGRVYHATLACGHQLVDASDDTLRDTL